MRNKNYFYFLLIILGLSSCIGAKKMGKASVKLNSLNSLHNAESNKVASITSISNAKLAERKIDSNINNRIQQRLSVIQHELDSIKKQMDNLKNLTANKGDFRKAYKKEIVPKLAQLDTFYKRYEDRMKTYLMLEDGLNTANYVLFDLAAFFGPGVYSIPPGKEQLAAISFLPMVDSLISFSNKYQDKSRTATLIILGFADGQNVNLESALHDTLTVMLQNTNNSKEVLNKKISELRAVELIKQLTTLFKQKVAEIKNIDQLNVEYIGQGKGEEFPIPSIKDYKEDDERRRVVLCYWTVLPNLP